MFAVLAPVAMGLLQVTGETALSFAIEKRDKKKAEMVRLFSVVFILFIAILG